MLKLSHKYTGICFISTSLYHLYRFWAPCPDLEGITSIKVVQWQDRTVNCQFLYICH